MAGKGKQPALMLYTGDWLKDPELGECEPSTRGIWIDWICCLKEKTAAGREPALSSSSKALARLARCSAEEALDAVLDLHRTDAATVTFPLHVTPDNAKVTDVVTVVSRRLQREHRAREGNAERQRRYREKGQDNEPGNANVTTPLSASASIAPSKEKNPKKDSSSSTEPTDRQKRTKKGHFDVWWAHYPRKIGKKEAETKWMAIPKAAMPAAEEVIDFIGQALKTDRWRNGYIKDGSAFVNQRQWEDDLSAYGDGRPDGKKPSKYPHGVVKAGEWTDADTERLNEGTQIPGGIINPDFDPRATLDDVDDLGVDNSQAWAEKLGVMP